MREIANPRIRSRYSPSEGAWSYAAMTFNTNRDNSFGDEALRRTFISDDIRLMITSCMSEDSEEKSFIMCVRRSSAEGIKASNDDIRHSDTFIRNFLASATSLGVFAFRLRIELASFIKRATVSRALISCSCSSSFFFESCSALLDSLTTFSSTPSEDFPWILWSVPTASGFLRLRRRFPPQAAEKFFPSPKNISLCFVEKFFSRSQISLSQSLIFRSVALRISRQGDRRLVTSAGDGSLPSLGKSFSISCRIRLRVCLVMRLHRPNLFMGISLLLE
mmetsp:Transcript_34559/g.55673  ORF Transcript_34559/g.55673 Transcript_34559/m.55673 type:complete len:277 (-) Transcript_34559:1327-2157(-)